MSVALARVDAVAVSQSRPPGARGHGGVAAGRYGGWSRRLEAVEWLLGAGLRSDLVLLDRDERAYTARKRLVALAALLLSPVVLVPTPRRARPASASQRTDMTTIPEARPVVTAGVNTHLDVHVAAAGSRCSS